VPADSTWTTLVYARNFAETLTFSYNSGEAASGMTSPLWVFLLGGTSWLLGSGTPLPEIAQLGGLLAAIGASALAYLLVKDLTVVKRYDAAIRGSVQVSANGQIVGVWRFPPGRYFFGEDQFVIPGRFVGEGTTVLRFENMPDSGDKAVSKMASYYYWIFVSEAK